MFKKYFVILYHCLSALLLFIPNKTLSQSEQTNHKRTLQFNCATDTTIIWPETIIPGSIYWESGGKTIEIAYELIENKIIVHCDSNKEDTTELLLHFEVLPYPFHAPITLWDSSQIRIVEGDIFYNPVETKPEHALIESTGLNYDGALTRGFSLGNNQSLVFDSELNLQLGGNIGDGYEIKAAITDNNLPIQPDGTTRQIQEFDKVYIEIKKDQHAILAGDFDAIHPEGYFMRYNRKLKGAQYSYSGKTINQPWNIKGSVAVSRGKFTRQTIIPTEGNQGPYPLRGENGELFIIVLAGSEKVYIDGQLMTRGENEDYIMDYNQSEITFTRNILINVRHRITVEFEYAQFNFQKSHNAFDARFQAKKIKTYLNFFQENDSKSVTGDLELTNEDLALLNMAGDAGGQFYKSGIRESTEGYNSNLILYSNLDTIVEGVVYPDILVWSTDPQEANLIVSFSEVGEGQGDYIISPNPSPNGRVYQWVSPDPTTGTHRGNFAPLIPLPAPQQKQMLTAGGELTIGKSGKIGGELAYSMQDFNRYSSIDDNDNRGTAIKTHSIHPIALGNSWSLVPFTSYERTGANFRTLDPYRNPEFIRDWNLTQLDIHEEEHLPSFGLTVGKSKKVYSQYKYEGLFRGNYSGNRHNAQIFYDTSGWKFNIALGILESKDPINKGKFFRPALHIERVIIKKGDWRIGSQYFEDKNEVRDRANDTLRVMSFIQNKTSLYIKNDPEANIFFFAAYHQERPKLPVADQFKLSEKVSEWNLAGHFHQWKDLKIEYTIRQRNTEEFISQPGNRISNLLGRLDFRADLFKKAFKWSAGYEIGNGQEPKVEYKYIKVQKGEGLYTWIDDGDGVEELNEFEQAPFADQGEYIRLSVFNSEFIRTRALGLQQTMNIDLKNLSQKGMISKIAALSTYQLNRKIREDESSPYWNPFYHQYADTAVLGNASVLRNILYWNRSSTVYDIQLGHVRQENQILQTSGFEIRRSEDMTLRWRISLRKKMDIVLNVRNGTRENKSEFFDSRNYLLSQFEAGPELNVILKDKFRLTGTYQYMSQKNEHGAENFMSNKFTFESVWRKSNTTDLRAQVSLVNIMYASAGNINIDFAILQGLQNGSNLLWSAQFNTRLNKTLILTLQYNGRDSAEVKTIHTGTAQVRATF